MGLINRIKSAVGLERREVNPNDPWAHFAALRTGSVTPESAQSVAAVYAAVAVISEAIGSLPLRLYRRGDDSRMPADDHPLHRCLHREPNEHQSSQEYLEWMTGAMLLHGNAYARVVRGWDGQVRALIPLAPERVTIMRKGDAIGGFEYSNRDGERERLLPDEVFHLRHRAGPDPLIGQSPIQAARAVIELAMAESAHGLHSYSNGARLSGVLTMPGVLKDVQRESLRTSWGTQYGGASNSGKVAILENGMQFQPIGMSNEDAEFVASRRFTVLEICRIFKVPPPLLADLNEANYSNAVETNKWFVSHCLGRHMSAWEGAISRQLLTDAGRRMYQPEFSAEGLLRGNSGDRADFYGKGIASGWLLPSEARRLENLPTVEGIDDGKDTSPAAA